MKIVKSSVNFTAMALLFLSGACTAPTQTGSSAPDAASATAVSSTAAVHELSGLPIVPLTIVSNGIWHVFAVEYAKTAQQQAQGLMFRTELADKDGMLFPNDPPQQRSFWMKNTVIPLDIIFIAPDGRIESIIADATPYSLHPISSRRSVAAVLEIAGGQAAQLGIRAGDMVKWDAHSVSGR
ncbi:DUF192 domain-containing protein [Croceicoccus sp. F390]|uniref:DUF192 domain-containing protein n=1 Tax=Croceicoccus esteveae TaxID=3075597 RepID=A0ABU2ZJN1_9SPHN|nr:DUF192 domain-containing protein [Croceicoccus sp. F390]MDT0576821.1 DUF192 domain-containing protein [Croceicoccus sp. F390]